MGGRLRNPFEKSKVAQARPAADFLSHFQRAKITSVDPDNGVCSLEFESTPSERQGVNIPLAYFSLPGPDNRTQAAWKRNMPSAGDLVIVGFDTNGEARIVSYDVIDYSAIVAIQAAENFGFVALKSGEFDEKSAGGAYIRGDLKGALFLAGGITTLMLDKKRNERTSRAGLAKTSSPGGVFRKGVVKRSPLPFLPEIEAKAGIGVPPAPTPATGPLPNLYEHTIDLRGENSATPLGRPMVFVSHGNVMDPDVDELTGGAGAWGAALAAGIKKFKFLPAANARFLWRVYDSAPGLTDTIIGTPGPLGGTTRPFEMGVDQLGNTVINLGATATVGYQIWAPTAIQLSSNILNLNGMVYLGGPPVPAAAATVPNAAAVAGGGAVCGIPFTTALAAFLSTINASFTAIAAAAAAVTAGTPSEMAAFSKALAAAVAPVAPAASTFSGSAATWVSKSVFVAPGPTVVPPPSLFQL